MDLLPPPNYIPVSIAAVYLIGEILAAETQRTGAKSDLPSFLKTERPPFAILYPEVPDEDPEEHDNAERFELKATKVEILKAQHRPDDLVSANGVRIFLTSKDGRSFYKRLGSGYPARDVVDVNVMLKPPYTTCLHPNRVRDGLNKTGLRSLQPSKVEERFALVCPSAMAASAGLALKQALADEIVAAIVIEEDGMTTSVPPGFWRTPKAEVALAQDVLVSVSLEGRVAVGHVYMSADAIRDGWAQILRFVQPQDPDHRFSPYIELAMQVSRKLHLVNGRDQIGARFPKDKVLQEVERLWAQFMPKELTTRLEQRKSYVAALVRHPEDDSGGFVSGKPVKPKADAEAPKRRRQPRAGGINTRKNA